MGKKKIISVYRYCYLQYLLFGFLMLLMALLPLTFSENPLVGLILWELFCCGLIIAFSLFLINSYQTAEFSAEGIVLKTPFGVIKSIAWNDIFKISEEKLVTGTAGMSIVYKMWIVIYIDRNQVSKYGGVNKKKKGPYTIAATTKNVEIINSFIKEYTNLPEIVMSVK